MKQKEQQVISRTEIADELRSVADMIEAGSMRVGDATVDIPEDSIEFEIELEETPEKIELEFELKWGTPGV